LAGSVTENDTKVSFASERMQAAECSHLRRLLSLDDCHRLRGVAMSIIVSISAVQSHTPDVDADEMSNSHCHWYRSLWHRSPLLSKAPRISS